MGALMGSGGVGGLQGTPGVSLPAGMAYHGGFGLSSGMMGAMGPAGMMGAGGMMGGAGMIGPAGGQLSAAGLMGMNSLMGPTGVLSTSGSLAGLPGSEGDLGALSASGLPPLSAIGIARTGSGPAGGVAGRQAGVDGPSHTGPGSAAKSQVAGRGTPGTGEGNENGLRALGGSSGDVSNSGLGGATGLPEDSNAQMGGREEGEGVVGSEDLNGRRESSGAVAMDSEDGEGLRDAGADSMKAGKNRNIQTACVLVALLSAWSHMEWSHVELQLVVNPSSCLVSLPAAAGCVSGVGRPEPRLFVSLTS